MKNDSLNFFNYNTWANARLFEHLNTLPSETSTETIKSIFPSIMDVLKHIYIIDKGWYSVLNKDYASDDYSAIQNAIRQLQAELHEISLQALMKKYEGLSSQLAGFITANDPEKVETFSSVPMSYADVFRHIVNHGTYHRGNVSAMLHQLGHKGVPTDYGLYVYLLAQKNKL